MAINPNFIGFGIAGALKPTAKRFYGALQSIFLAPIQRWASYQVNAQNPNVIPDASDLTSFYRQKLMEWPGVKQMLSYQGIDAPLDVDYPYSFETENGILILKPNIDEGKEVKPGDLIRWESFFTPGIEIALDLYFRGVISRDVFVHWLNREGIDDNEIINAIINSSSQVAAPADGLRNQLRQQFEENTGLGLRLMAEWDPSSPLVGYLRAAGYRNVTVTADGQKQHSRDQAELWWENHWSLPSYEKAVSMFQKFRPNRMFRYAELFPDIKTVTPKDLAEFGRLNDVPPGIRQMVAADQFNTIGVRHVRLLTRYGIIDEAETAEHLIDSGYLPIDARKLASLYKKQKDTILPVATELKQYHRGNLKEADLRASLASRGYTEKQSDLAIDESQPILSIAQIRSMARKNIISSQEFIKLVEQHGYKDKDIDLLYTETMWHYRDKYTQLGVSAIHKAYEVGYETRGDAKKLLVALGITDQEAEQGLAAIEVEINTSILRTAINDVRRQLYGGYITIQQANQFLITLNVAVERRNLYIRQWSIHMSVPRKQISASEIVKAIRLGIINEAEGVRRLNNLGFDSGSIQFYLTQSALERTVDANRALMQASRTVAQHQKASLAAIKAHAQQGKALRADLSRHSSPGQLKKWITLGLIGDNEALARLEELGWPPDDANRLIEEAHIAAAKKQGKAASPTSP